MDWACRLDLEALSFGGQTSFDTFTYAADRVPYTESGLVTLEKGYGADLIRRLRRNTQLGLRHFVAPEYGEKSGIPHYHAVLFGMSPLLHRCDWRPNEAEAERMDSLGIRWRDYRGFELELLRAHQCRGMIQAGELLPGGSSYAAKYTTKSLVDFKTLAPDQVPEREARSMSRMPGLGTAFAVKLAESMKRHKLYPAERPDLKPAFDWKPQQVSFLVKHMNHAPGAKHDFAGVSAAMPGRGRSKKVFYLMPRILREKVCQAYGEDLRTEQEVQLAQNDRLLFPSPSQIVVEVGTDLQALNRRAWVASERRRRKL